MGSPLGPTLANIFLCHHEQIWLNNCPNEYKPSIYRRYIDDTFLSFDNSQQSISFLNYLNGMHANIEFTVELPVNDSLPFLDLNIHINDHSLDTSVFRKATFSGLGTSYFSNVPMLHKLNAIRTLIHRAYHLCSTFSFFCT